MVGSATATLTSDLARGWRASQATPAALSPLGGPLALDLNPKPLLSGRNVVLIGFLASGLGLLEFLAVLGIGNDGGGPNPADGGIGAPLLLLRVGRAGEAKSEDEAVGVVYPRRALEPLLATRLTLLKLLGVYDSPRSARLSLRVTSKSTRSLH